MYCYELQKKSLILCVMIVLTRLCYVLLLSCYLGGFAIVQPFCKKKVACFAHKKETPFSKQSSGSLVKPFKKNHMLMLVFLALVCFTLEFTLAQLIEPHSLTTRPTQVSLCTCYVKKNRCLVSSCATPIKAMFLSISPCP
jgi:F0F1-type ATP synthase assembly protein I